LSTREGGGKVDKEMRKIIRALEDQGFEITITRRGHVVVTRDGKMIATLAGTASDRRSLRNGLAYLKRAGFRWPPGR
jgi:hypothetical protein